MRLTWSLERGALAAFGASDGEGLKEWFATNEGELIQPTEAPPGLAIDRQAYRSPMLSMIPGEALGIVRIDKKAGVGAMMTVVPTEEALFAGMTAENPESFTSGLSAWMASGAPRQRGSSLMTLTADVHTLVDNGFLSVPASEREQTPSRFEMSVEREQLTLRVRARTFTPQGDEGIDERDRCAGLSPARSPRGSNRSAPGLEPGGRRHGPWLHPFSPSRSPRGRRRSS